MQRLLNEMILNKEKYFFDPALAEALEKISKEITEENEHNPENNSGNIQMIVDMISHHEADLLAVAAWDAYKHYPDSILGKLVDYHLSKGWNIKNGNDTQIQSRNE